MARFKLSYKKSINLQEFLNILVTIFLFLAFFNFITKNYYWMFIAFTLFIITPKRKVVFSFSTAFLFVLGLSILVLKVDDARGITNILKPFVFVMAYVLGTGMIPRTDDYQLRDHNQYLEKVIYLCAFGFFAHYTLNFISNIGALERNTVDIWTDSVLSATGQASLATMGVAVIVAILFSDKSIGKKIIAFIVAFVIVAYNMILAGRTLLYMLVIGILIAFLFRSVARKKHFRNIVLTIGLVLVAVFVVYNFNLFNIRTFVEDSNLYQRIMGKSDLGIVDDLRFDYKAYYLENFFDHPLGGGHLRAECLHYAHDLYLDGYDQYGIFAFIALVAYIVASLTRLIKGLRSQFMTSNVKQLLLCTYLLLNIQFLIEPVLDGMPFLFVAYCLIDGVLTRLLANQAGMELYKGKV